MLRLQNQFIEKIKIHARHAYPEECCGILLGTSEGPGKVVQEVLQLDNSSEQMRTRRFVITPDDYLSAENQARKKGLDVLGFYHSHPDHPARPSQFDLEHAYPFWSYVIIGVNQGKPAAVASWLLQEDRSRFDEEQVEIVDANSILNPITKVQR